MSKELSVIFIGLAVVVIPYLGIPSAGRTLLLVLAGSALIIIGLLLRAQTMIRGKHSPYQHYVENDTAKITHDYSHENHKEGITSLN